MRQHLQQCIRILRSAAIPALAGFVVFGLAACGDDGPTGPDVSQQQAEEVAAAVNSGVFQAFGIATGGSGSASRAPSALAPRSYEMPTTISDGSYTFDNSTSCPQGGSLSASGDGTINTSQTQNTTTIEWDWNAQASYSNCGVETDQGNIFVLNTSSPIQFTGNGTVTSDQAGGGTGSFTWNYSGTIDWDEQGGPSASCDVDLTTTLDLQSSQNTFELSGSVRGTTCGRDINRTFSTTFSA